MLVRNMSEKRGTGMLRNHKEDKIHKIFSTIGDDSVTYSYVGNT